MSVAAPDDTKGLRKDELNKLKTKSRPKRKKGPENSGSPSTEAPSGDPKVTIRFTRELGFKAGDYDLIILPYGEQNIRAEFERHEMFADGRLMQEVMAATSKFEAPYAYVPAGRLLLIKASNSGKMFAEALAQTLGQISTSTSNNPIRIIDTTDYSRPNEFPFRHHILTIASELQNTQTSVQYDVVVTPNSAANLNETLSSIYIGDPKEPFGFDNVQIIGLDGQPISTEETTKPSSFRTRSHLESDQPSPNDYLGFQSVADSVAAFVQHKSTRLPLCIAIDGPWGSGKSSMMLMIQEALQKGSTRAREKLKTAPGLFGSLRQSLWLAYLTFEPLIILGAIGFMYWWYRANPEAAANTLGGGIAIGAAVYVYLVGGTYLLSGLKRRRRRQSKQRHFETITINAWRYGDGVRLKASIVQSIISELLERRGARFFLKLRLLRLNRMALLTSLSKSLFQSWFFVGGAIALGLGLVAYNTLGSGTSTWLESIMEVLGQELPQRYGDTLFGFLIAGAGVLGQLSKNGDVASVDDFIANPDYESLMGPDEEIEEDFRRILQLLEDEGYTLAIFIDDLDRCSPTAVHKVVEALNVFFGQPDCRCLFVLGMHKEMVATSLEVAYSAIADKMAGNCLLEEQRPFGRRFLEKIVQFVLHVPKPREEQVETYLQHMTSGMTDADFRALAKQEAEEKKPTTDLFSRRLQRLQSYNVYLWQRLLNLFGFGRSTDLAPPPQPIAAQLAMIESDETAKARLDEERERVARFEARLEAAANFTEGSDENIQMFSMVRPALGSNPRQYKRYFNQLRFNRFITEDRQPESEEKSLYTDAVMAAIALECPEAYQWAYSTLTIEGTERNIDAALRCLKNKVAEDLPDMVPTLDDAMTIEQRVHLLLRTNPAFMSLLQTPEATAQKNA